MRTSPWPGVGLREGLHRADEAGSTAVDFVVLAFRPIDDSYKAGVDPETHFRYFEWDHPDYRHIKAWKQPRRRADLASHAGHEVCFRGRKVFPEKFQLKHYSMRHPDQSKRKIFVERLGGCFRQRWPAAGTYNTPRKPLFAVALALPGLIAVLMSRGINAEQNAR